jgi:uncharacterized RDD family membrane protein YckC
VSDLPAYPQDAAEREAAAQPGAERTYSSWGRRVGAYLIDGLLLAIPIAIAFIVVIASGPDDDGDDAAWAVLGIAYLITLVLPFIYFTVMHGGASGQTYGKRWLGIRVASDEAGDSIGYGRAFGRYAITVVFSIFLIPLLLDYLWPLWDTKNQALHDKVVGSVVVRA